MHNAYSSIVLFAGGSGIVSRSLPRPGSVANSQSRPFQTYALGVLEEILSRSANGLARTNSISLIWSVKAYGESHAVIHLFTV
jgi:hypothetical protein